MSDYERIREIAGWYVDSLTIGDLMEIAYFDIIENAEKNTEFWKAVETEFDEMFNDDFEEDNDED